MNLTDNKNSESVLNDYHNGVVTLVLNSPRTGNVVNDDNLNLICKYIKDAEDNKQCRVIILKGSRGVFSRGMDFKFMLRSAKDGIDQDFSEPYRMAVSAIRNSKKITIAAVDGEVTAGGIGLMLACDIVLSTSRSQFVLSEVLFGIIPAYVFVFLLERMPLKKARFLVLSSKKIDASGALHFGLIDELVKDNDLEKALLFYIKRLLASSPDALALVKSYSDSLYTGSFKNRDDETGKNRDDKTGKNSGDKTGKNRGDETGDFERSLDFATETLTGLLKNTYITESIENFMDGDKMPWALRYKKRKISSL